MFREIRRKERITEKNEEHKNYLKIKPEKEMTVAELNAAVNEIFRNISKEES